MDGYWLSRLEIAMQIAAAILLLGFVGGLYLLIKTRKK